MAGAFGAKGARILSVSPGSFDTAMGRLEEKSGSVDLVDHAALQRYGRLEEIAEVLAFCASERPGYLTGTDILCDGGHSRTHPQRPPRHGTRQALGGSHPGRRQSVMSARLGSSSDSGRLLPGTGIAEDGNNLAAAEWS